MRDRSWLWLVLAVVLCLLTFGQLVFLLTTVFIFLLAGFLVVIYFMGKKSAAQQSLTNAVQYELCSNGVEKIQSLMEPTTKIKNFDKRMTGASVIDDVLKEVLQFTIRDYIKTWYRQLSDHDSFLVDIWQCVQKVVITFSNRSKEIDWTPYFTERLVDEFASHLRLYRRAAERTTQANNEENSALLESAFFDMEVEMENNMCRDMVCLEPEAERQYLQDLSEVLLFLLLPTEDFHNKPFRYIIREVLVNGIFMPTVDLLSDPDYVNQYIAWLCYESSFTRESLLTVIRSSYSSEELEAVKDKVDSDIARWRSKDTGGSDDSVIKQNLNSLMFLRDTCDNRLKSLSDGQVAADQIIEVEEPEYINNQSLYILTLDDIFNNNVALQFFIEYMTCKGGQQYLFFYLNVEGFRTAAEQQISAIQKHSSESQTPVEPDLESLRRAAMIIYDQYLSEKATSRIKIEADIVKYTLKKIKSKMLSEDVFDTVQARVYQILHCDYYEEFLHCPSYIKLLEQLGFLHHKDEGEQQSPSEDTMSPLQPAFSTGSSEQLHNENTDQVIESPPDSASLSSNSSLTSAESPSGEAYIFAQIAETGIVKEPQTGKSYAVFAITVHKKDQYSEGEEIWDVYRRYSDFHDLHMMLTEKFTEMTIPVLPGKTVLKNTNQKFLDKRRRELDKYLRSLLKTELLQTVNGLEELLSRFLHKGIWEKHKSEFSRKMDTIVHPIKTASRNVGTAVKSVPDGMSKIGDGIGRVFSSQRSMEQTRARELMNQMKVGAGLDPEEVENIPMRIMLLMMDEIFDLKHKNQWLRRRIVAILRQLIKATFGDKINRKIVDHVDLMTSAEQMAEYVAAFRNSFWPNGLLSDPRPCRDQATKMRTRILCRAKMLGSVPDEVRTLMGTDSVRQGVARVFQMFQHKTLNKRFLYVVMEGVLVTLFPDNKFQPIFRKLHSRSKRAERLKENRDNQQETSSKDTQNKKRPGKR